MLTLLHANLIDGSGQPLRRDVAICIEDGRICAVAAALPAGAGAAVDLRGAYVLPGLIDLHTHISGSAGFDHPAPGRRVNTYDYAEAREGFLDWGVLTVRTCGDVCPDVLAFRDEAKAGKTRAAPRVFAAGPWVQGVNAHPLHTVYGADPLIAAQGCYCVDDGSDLEDVVRRIKAQNADWLKLFYGGNPLLFGGRPMTRMSEACLRTLTALGHRYGLKVMVHVDGASDMAAAADAGVDTVEHCLAAGYDDDGFTPALYARLRRQNIAVIPTMVVSKRFGGGVPWALATHERLRGIVRDMHAAGVTVCAGCDSGVPFVPFGESLHEELACLVSAGFTPMEAILAATSESAGLLGCGDAVGTVAPGFAADLLIVKRNPLEDIANTRQVQMVIRAGAIVRDRMTGCLP